MKIDISTVKLIIWDLDDTLWSGTLSEGKVHLPEENIQLIKNLTDCGIINSICSKNELEPTKKHLQDLQIWDLFVFPSINWNSKGPQLKEKLDKMALRPENVLFIDDNPSNLGEAKHYLPFIQVAGPDIIPDLIEQVNSLEKKDVQHKRLKQYKILEEKDTASKSFSNSEDFLYNSHIRVEIKHDCLSQIQRIHELLLRSNQLNYTKKRINIEELGSILQNEEYDCGYVTVKDRFGDYGIVGFFVKKGDHLEHFLFSCRTMGQKIEQWVYAQLGFPQLDVVGEVRTQLNTRECPGWINQETSTEYSEAASTQNEHTKSLEGCRILLKGPCDLSHSKVYIKKNSSFDTEFTYIDDKGRTIDAHNHSVHIEGLHTYSDEDKKKIIHDCPFVDPAMLDGLFFSKQYDIIFLSTLIESVRLIYRKKGTNIKVAYGGPDLTDPNCWKQHLDVMHNGENSITREWLEYFSSQWECLGMTTPTMYTSFLENILDWLPKETKVCLILGATGIYNGAQYQKKLHKELNDAIKSFANTHNRIKYIEIDECVSDASDFTDSINHFSTRVYYNLAMRMIDIINQITGEDIQAYSARTIYIDRIILRLRQGIKQVISEDSHLYMFFKRFYNRIYKQRG